MRLRSLVAALAVILLVAACSREDSSGRGAPQSPKIAAADKAANKPLDRDAAAALESGKPATITRLNEDGSETVEQTSGDSGTHNPLLAAVSATVAATTSSAVAATAGALAAWQQGVNYTQLVPVQPTSVPAGQVEVLEFFWYACPHCFALEPSLDKWLKSKPSYITFVRVPVLWDEGRRSLARLYYTLDSMGKLAQFNADVFKEIHVNGNPLVGADPSNAAQAENVQLAFIKRLGIPEADFEKAYHSFDVQKSMERADELVQRYKITAVPTFVINGKYVADVGTAGGPEKLIAMMGDLTAQEHKR